MTRVALASLLFLLSAALRSQTRELYTDWDTFLSEFLDSETASGDDDDTALDALCQRLELLAAAPLDLNAATREDLLGLPFLNETQADSLLRYRERRGRFVTLGELMFVTGLDARTRRWLSLFVRLLPETVPPAPLRQRLFGGRHRLETRLDIPLLYARRRPPRPFGLPFFASAKRLSRQSSDPCAALSVRPRGLGRGFASAAVAEIRLARRLTGGVRAACLRYFDRDTQSSGAMQIFSPAKADLALQLQWTL